MNMCSATTPSNLGQGALEPGLVAPDQIGVRLRNWTIPVAEAVCLESALVPAIQPSIGLDRAMRVWTHPSYFRKRLPVSEALAPYLSFVRACTFHGVKPLGLTQSPMQHFSKSGTNRCA